MSNVSPIVYLFNKIPSQYYKDDFNHSGPPKEHRIVLNSMTPVTHTDNIVYLTNT